MGWGGGAPGKGAGCPPAPCCAVQLCGQRPYPLPLLAPKAEHTHASQPDRVTAGAPHAHRVVVPRPLLVPAQRALPPKSASQPVAFHVATAGEAQESAAERGAGPGASAGNATPCRGRQVAGAGAGRGSMSGLPEQRQHCRVLLAVACKPGPAGLYRVGRHARLHEQPPPGPQGPQRAQQVAAEGPGVEQARCLASCHIGGGKQGDGVHHHGTRAVKQHLAGGPGGQAGGRAGGVISGRSSSCRQ